jgi:hypothetical protein
VFGFASVLPELRPVQAGYLRADTHQSSGVAVKNERDQNSKNPERRDLNYVEIIEPSDEGFNATADT